MEMFVWVQEPKYYDRIMLLVREKFAEIVKICETIEDGLKIARIAVSLGSSGLLKKKREYISAISSEGRKTHKRPSFYQDRT